MEITTVVGCGIACAYCPQDRLAEAYTRGSDVRRLTFELFAACLERLPRKEKIVFAGMAEPWLNADCTRMALHAHRRGHPVGVYTTLIGVTPADIAALAEIPFRQFSVHLPSHPPTERIRYTPRYRATMEALLGSGIEATWHTHGPATHPEAAAILAAAGVTVGFVRNHNRTGNVDWVPDEPLKTGPIACRRREEHVLLPNGDVALCCMDYGLRYVLGNLSTQTREEIAQSPPLQELLRGLREETSDAPCRRCVLSVPVRRR